MHKAAIIAGFLILIVLVSGCTSQQTTNAPSDNQQAVAQPSCTPLWNCAEWAACKRINATAGMQERLCSDANNCNSTSKPAENQSCELPSFTSKEISELALQLSDFPVVQTNWTLKERTERTKSEISEEALAWGWQKGYRVQYYRLGGKTYAEVGSSLDTTGLEQLISYYPVENITKTIRTDNSSIYGYYRNLSKNNIYYQFDDLSDPKIGYQSIAYRITKTSSGSTEITYFIEFHKLNVYEMLTMWGQTLDYEFFKEMAEKAADKIE